MDTVNLTKIHTDAGASVNRNTKTSTASDATDSRREEIISVARKFEALMLHTMLKSMRATIVEDELTGSNGQDMYRDMMDQEIAKNISESGGFGIQAVLARQLGANMGVDTVQRSDTTAVNGTESGSVTESAAASTATRSKLAQLQQYQKLSGANDLMFNTQSSLID